MSKKVLILPGDGVGPEVTNAAASVLNTVTDALDIEYSDIGLIAYDKTEQYLPAETIDLATEADAIITGPVIDRINDKKYRNPLRVLRKQLHLYSVYRKFYPLCDRIGMQNVDLIVVTGNPDSLLNIIETESLDGVRTEKMLSTVSCTKLFRKTIEIAELKNRKKVTCAHRRSVFPTSDNMFLDIFYKEFAGSGFQINDMEVGLVASELVVNPTKFDVIASTDLYGVTIAGIGAGMVGGNYLTPMGSIGDHAGLFEPMHGPRPELVGKNAVNPTSSILSAAMALDHCMMPEQGEMIRKAVRAAYKKNCITPDMGGSATTQEFTQFVIDTLKKEM